MQIAEFHPPLFAFRVPAGFPSPADDYIDKRLDLNELLVPRPAATLFYWVQDLAMDKSTFWPGDILIVDHPDFPAIELKEGLDYRILGVVRHRIHEV